MKPTHYRYRDMLQKADTPDGVITRAAMLLLLRQHRRSFERGRHPHTFAIWINGFDRRVYAPVEAAPCAP